MTSENTFSSVLFYKTGFAMMLFDKTYLRSKIFCHFLSRKYVNYFDGLNAVKNDAISVEYR
jgi:hypothetical protein